MKFSLLLKESLPRKLHSFEIFQLSWRCAEETLFICFISLHFTWLSVQEIWFTVLKTYALDILIKTHVFYFLIYKFFRFKFLKALIYCLKYMNIVEYIESILVHWNLLWICIYNCRYIHARLMHVIHLFWDIPRKFLFAKI